MSARIFIFLLALCTGSAQAFVATLNLAGDVQHWDLAGASGVAPTNSVNTNLHAIRFFIASDAFSTTNTAAELNAVRASFAQWQVIPGTSVKFEDAGLIGPGVDINTEDHTNVVYWVKAGTIVNGTVDMSGALGLTFTSFTEDNIISEADIVLNGHDCTWFTDLTDTSSNPNHFHIEGTLLHEIGHFIGLRHSPVGGATMLAKGGSGSSAVQIGLSEDEFAAARYLYPPAAPASLGTLQGTVNDNLSNPVLGAAIIAENSAGNIVSGTVSQGDGTYQIPALPPGTYNIRVTPMDRPTASFKLITGADIDADFATAYTDFFPSSTVPTTLTGGATNTLDFTVTNGLPPFHVSHIRPPTSNPLSYGAVDSPTSIRPGQSNMTIGVFGPTLPTNGVTLTITGDGISFGAITYTTNLFAGLNGISVIVGVASNATPGLRSFIVNRTNDQSIACANGFLEVSPLTLDLNFDGLDDLFQRKYFPLFTAAQAGPAVDADGDGYNNLAEYLAGSNPTNGASFLQIQSTTQNTGGTTITWTSEAGKKYQVLSRAVITGTGWTTNANVTGSGATTQFTDATGLGGKKFYRVQAVP